MKIKVDWRATIAAAATVIVVCGFPLVNPCSAEDGVACTWNAQEAGNGVGSSFTDFYGLFTVSR